MPSASQRKKRPKIKTVGIVVKPQPRRASALLARILRWLSRHRVGHALDVQTARLLGPQCEGLERVELAAVSDVLVVVGGDGTLLSVARDIGPSRTPILGVNLGSLGFLTEVSLGELEEALQAMVNGQCKIQMRRRLVAEIVRDGATFQKHEILNDVVVAKSALARVLDIHVEVDGAFMTTFRADGLIVSTPTGSTAYSLSAGGPIVDPSVDAVILSPICPHTLTNRPVVIPGGSVIEAGLADNHGEVYVTIDGQVGLPFLPGDRIRIRKSRHAIRLLHFPEKDYFEVLRQKLKWSGRVLG